MIPAGLAVWAAKYQVPYVALAELATMLGVDTTPAVDVPADTKSEAFTQSMVRLEAPGAGCFLWRNNVGVLEDETGRPVRYGLANDSKALNKRLKSSDLVGWRRVLITPHHVGTTIAQFLTRECKRQGWRWSGTEREVAQNNWNTLVLANGGDAAFTTGPGTL